MKLRTFKKKIRQGMLSPVFSKLGESIIPETDDAVDLGTAAKQFRDVYVDGIAYIDQVRGELATVIPVTNSPVTQTGSLYVSGDGSYFFVRIAGAWKSGSLA